MKIHFKLLLLVFVLNTSFMFSQNFAFKKYTWENSPKLHEVSDKEKENNYIVLKDKFLYEFAYETSGQLVMYETRHTIIRFNNEKGIEEMNKVYVPYGKVLEEMDLKARTITSAGKIIPLSKSSIKKVDNLENAGPFMIFAMEGVDNGAEIEYLYTNKKTTVTSGVLKIQNDKMHKDVTIDIYSPSNLVFEAKGYNGFPEFKKDTILEDKNHIYTSISVVEGLDDEKYSAYEANKMRCEYQLTYNTSRNMARLNSWESIGLDMYNALYTFTKQDIKAIDKLISKLSLAKLSSDELKIKAIDDYMKMNINVKESSEESSVDKMLDVKYGDELNFHKAYIAAAKQLNIPIELVLTTDRFSRKFDADFSSWNNIQEYLFYFPSVGKYLSASSFSSRLGYAPPECTGGKGLFIKETEIGDTKAPISKIKKIDFPDYTNSYNNITAQVEFDKESFTPKMTVKQELMGYSAFYIQPTVMFLDENQKKEFLENMSKFIGKECIVKSSKVSGNEKEDVYVKPLTVECVIEGPQLVENAGNKYLFKVGALLGPQEELYQEKARQTEGEIQYTHSFTRIIEIKIPQGYKIKNLDEINNEKKYTVDGKELASFVSNYTVEGDKVKIKVYEDYRTLLYPKSNFEAFRKVINAAADFNKVVLIFEKL